VKTFPLLALRAVAAAGGLALASVASAAPPTLVTGPWTILTDKVYTTLDITSQGGAGAPGSSECRVINGNFSGAPIRGFYCPRSGRIHFLHNNMHTNDTVRTFTGAVSQDANGVMHMAGTFNVLAAVFGDHGEYPFSASK
jgi:hypothetical protein